MLLSATDWTKQVALGILEINKSNTMGKEGTRFLSHKMHNICRMHIMWPWF